MTDAGRVSLPWVKAALYERGNLSVLNKEIKEEAEGRKKKSLINEHQMSRARLLNASDANYVTAQITYHQKTMVSR